VSAKVHHAAFVSGKVCGASGKDKLPVTGLPMLHGIN